MRGKQVQRRVLVADGQELLREGLIRFLEQQPDVQIVGKSQNGPEAVRMAQTLAPDVIVVDYPLPGLAAPEVIRRIRTSLALARIIALSLYTDEIVIKRLLESGADAFVPKDANLEEILRIILGEE